MRVAVYLRQSKEREGSVSIEVQEADCRRYVEERGWRVAEVFVDRDESGSSARSVNRPAYRRLLDCTELWDAVIVWRIDRGGRRESEYFRMIEDIEGRGKVLLSATEDVSDPLMRGIRIVLAANEARELGKRSARARRYKVEQGFFMAKPPYGCVVVDGLLQPGPYFWVIRELFERVSAGEGVRAVGASLNRRLPQPLSYRVYQQAIWNDSYLGVAKWRDVRAAAQWAPLLPEALVMEARRRTAERRRHRGRGPERANVWVDKLAVCGGCGGPMRLESGYRYNRTRGPDGQRLRAVYYYLRCRAYNRVEMTPGCGVGPRSVWKVQPAALQSLRAQLAALHSIAPTEDEITTFLREAAAVAGGGESRDGLVAELDALAARRRKVADLWSRERISDAEGDRLMAEIVSDERAVKAQLAALSAPAVADPEDVIRAMLDWSWLAWADSDPEAFGDALRVVADAVVVGGPAGLASVRLRLPA